MFNEGEERGDFRLVDIGGIVDHRCLNVLLIRYA